MQSTYLKRTVIIESPFAGAVAYNLKYIRAAMRDCLLRGEAPFASHALYTQAGVLRDDEPSERALGIWAGLTWGLKIDATVVYCDLGISKGMQMGVEAAKEAGREVEFRRLHADWKPRLKVREWSGKAWKLTEPVQTNGGVQFTVGEVLRCDGASPRKVYLKAALWDSGDKRSISMVPSSLIRAAYLLP